MNFKHVLLSLCLFTQSLQGQSKNDLKSALAATKAQLEAVKSEKDKVEQEKQKAIKERELYLNATATVAKENAALKEAAQTLVDKAKDLADQKTVAETLLKTQQDTTKVQAYTIDNLTTVRPTEVTVKREQAIASLVTRRHAEDTAAFKHGSTMATLAAEKATKAVTLGEENHKAIVETSNQLTQHTRIINDIHQSIVSSDRLQVIMACCLVFLMALVVLLFIKSNRITP